MNSKEQKINTLIEDSGILTHFKTTKILRENNWSVLVSPYYHDSISDTIRETDLVAEKRFDSGHQQNSSTQVNIQLFIECKYIKQEIVFWFDEVDKHARYAAIDSLAKETGLTIAYDRAGGYDAGWKEFHYLQTDSVAKLFSTNSNKEDVIYKAMNQSLHSQIYYRQRGKRPIFHKFNEHREIHSQIIQYPIIVCDNFDNLLQLKFKDDSKFYTDKITNHFLLETNYRDDYFLIDIVDLNYLETFLKEILEKEAESLVRAHGFKSRH